MNYLGLLKVVRELLSKLTDDEKASIRLYLGFFMEKGRHSSNKSLRLFDLLISLKDKVVSEDEIELMIYDKPNPKAFSRLTARLRDKILEGVLLDINIEREGAYPDKSKAVIEIRKNITQAQIFQNRGARKFSEMMFEKAIENGKRFELYEEIILALRYLIKQRSLDEGRKSLKGLLAQYEKYDYAKNAVLRAEINHREIICETDFVTEPDLHAEKLKQVLDSMRSDYKKTGSSQIGYYYFLIETQYYQLLNNYKNARKSLLNTERLLELHISIGDPQKRGTVLLNLADNDLYLRKFDRSFITTQEALKYLKAGSFNYFQGVELLFYSRFYGGQYESAKTILAELFHKSTAPKNFRSGKRIYLLACTYFMLGDFQTAHGYLKVLNPIEEDKEGWNVSIRILLIMTLIELEFFDEATAKIESLRKFQATISKENKRLNLIYSLLNALSNNGFVFKTVYLKEKNKIELLDSRQPGFEWKFKSGEMVIFQQWFSSKLFRHKFQLFIPSQQVQIKRRSLSSSNIKE